MTPTSQLVLQPCLFDETGLRESPQPSIAPPVSAVGVADHADAASASRAGVLESGVEVVTPTGLVRTQLAAGAWVDYLPGWLPDSASKFFHLLDSVKWRSEERLMYENVVAVPRLVAWHSSSQSFPTDWLGGCLTALNAHYQSDGRVPASEMLQSAGMCLYRDGQDSVAWHGDRIGRGRTQDTLVAIISLGSPRVLKLRPVTGGRSIGFSLGNGDLLVMGGSCQRTYEHCVPKSGRPVGPRISVQFRPHGVA